MSVIVRNMEMPTSCADCPIGDSLCCSLMPGVPALWKEYTLAIRTNRRHEDCPLVPVPPHGRLIDADALLDDLLFPSKQFEQGMRELIGDAPTIIPAEETNKEATNDQNNS